MRRALILAALLLATPALAAQKKPVLTGDPVKDIQSAIARTDAGDGVQGGGATSPLATRAQLLQTLAKPFQDLVAIIGDDVANAILESTVVPDIQDGHGQQCWIGLRNFASVAKAHPLPLTGHGATDLEALRLYAIATNQLCLNVHCTQMFSDYKAMAQSAAQGIGGVLAAAAVNNVPTLQDICTKVPQIAIVAPLSPVPAAPDIAPVGLDAPAKP